MNTIINLSRKAALLLLLLTFILPPITSQAQIREYTLLEPIPCVNKDSRSTANDNCVNGYETKVDLVRYLNLMFKIAIGLAGVFAVLMIVIGGFQYATTDAIGGKQEGKQRITQAIEGLLLALVSYFILYTIDPRFVNFNIELDPLPFSEYRVESSLTEDLGNIAKQANNRQAELLKQADDLEKQAHDLFATGDYSDTEINELLVKANNLKIEANDVWAEATIEQHYRNALDNIKGSGSLTQEGVDSIKRAKNGILRTTQEAGNKGQQLGDTYAQGRYASEGRYYEYTLDEELKVAQLLKNFDTTADPGFASGQRQTEAYNDAKKYIEELKNGSLHNPGWIQPPLNERYLKERDERIMKLQTTMGIK